MYFRRKIMKFTRQEKHIVGFSLAVSLMFAVFSTSYAMHIMEGFLSPQWAAFWGALAIPFLVADFFSIKKRIDISSKILILLALCGAFAFVLSALKLPSITGSCSHPTGVGLGAIMFGPMAMSVINIMSRDGSPSAWGEVKFL
jgi:cobalt/nickel transport system permease protein